MRSADALDYGDREVLSYLVEHPGTPVAVASYQDLHVYDALTGERICKPGYASLFQLRSMARRGLVDLGKCSDGTGVGATLTARGRQAWNENQRWEPGWRHPAESMALPPAVGDLLRVDETGEVLTVRKVIPQVGFPAVVEVSRELDSGGWISFPWDVLRAGTTPCDSGAAPRRTAAGDLAGSGLECLERPRTAGSAAYRVTEDGVQRPGRVIELRDDVALFQDAMRPDGPEWLPVSSLKITREPVLVPGDRVRRSLTGWVGTVLAVQARQLGSNGAVLLDTVDVAYADGRVVREPIGALALYDRNTGRYERVQR